MFDAMAAEGCYFLVPSIYRGIVASITEYEHGHQFVFDSRISHIFVKDAISGETKGIIEGLAIPGHVANAENQEENINGIPI